MWDAVGAEYEISFCKLVFKEIGLLGAGKAKYMFRVVGS